MTAQLQQVIDDGGFTTANGVTFSNFSVSITGALAGSLTDVGRHTVTLRWINPGGSELWTSTGELNVGQPPGGVTEMDLPLIAQIDLPIDGAGSYRMTVSLDDRKSAEVPVQVRTVQAVRPPGGMFS